MAQGLSGPRNVFTGHEGSSSCFAEDGYLALFSDNSHLHTRFLRIIGCYVVSTQSVQK